ncbi:MAG: ion transporter [Methanomicrobiales archaeon]|nr:ion transporter [Methanomicrobiales archaeon]
MTAIALRRRTREILEIAAGNDSTSRYFDIFIISMICANVVAVMLESVDGIAASYPGFFYGFEVVSITVFSIEYLLRIWSATEDPRYAEPVRGRFRYAATPFALIDLVAILPFFVPFFIPFDLRFVRSLRLLRIFRVLKMARYSSALRLLGGVLKKELPVITIVLLVVFLILIMASSLMYYAERDAQPMAFASIPAAMWWAIVTLTTVGYGDVCPITPLGKFLGAIIALLGIGLIAVPAGVLASGFVEELHHRGRLPRGQEARDRIERLQHLKEGGLLTDREFDVLAGGLQSAGPTLPDRR